MSSVFIHSTQTGKTRRFAELMFKSCVLSLASQFSNLQFQPYIFSLKALISADSR